MYSAQDTSTIFNGSQSLDQSQAAEIWKMTFEETIDPRFEGIANRKTKG